VVAVTTATANQSLDELLHPDKADVLDVRGAMALLKVGRSTVYQLAGRNEIPHRRVGSQLRFSRAALLRWLEGK
jgi:excisionase family DNA binding protein